MTLAAKIVSFGAFGAKEAVEAVEAVEQAVTQVQLSLADARDAPSSAVPPPRSEEGPKTPAPASGF